MILGKCLKKRKKKPEKKTKKKEKRKTEKTSQNRKREEKRKKRGYTKPRFVTLCNGHGSHQPPLRFFFILGRTDNDLLRALL